MRSISQYNEISDDAIKLRFLLDGSYNTIKSTESIIFCKMRNKTGCLLDICPHFTSLTTSLANKEDRCTFPIHCGDIGKYLLLATYKIEEAEEIERLTVVMTENISNYVTRWRDRTQCKFKELYIEVESKKVFVIWERKSPFYQPAKFIEDIYSASRELSDKKASIIMAVKRGEY